jgi:hypothetical protein
MCIFVLNFISVAYFFGVFYQLGWHEFLVVNICDAFKYHYTVVVVQN